MSTTLSHFFLIHWNHTILFLPGCKKLRKNNNDKLISINIFPGSNGNKIYALNE